MTESAEGDEPLAVPTDAAAATARRRRAVSRAAPPPAGGPRPGAGRTERAHVHALLAVPTDAVAATARRLRAVILDAHPQLVDRVRPGWHSLNYAAPAAGFVCAVFPFAERVQLV